MISEKPNLKISTQHKEIMQISATLDTPTFINYKFKTDTPKGSQIHKLSKYY